MNKMKSSKFTNIMKTEVSCMETKQKEKANLLNVLDAVVQKTMKMDMTWEWPCGVAYYGICKAYRVTGKEEYMKLVKDRVDEFIELGLPTWTVNACAMGHCLIDLYQVSGEKQYYDIIQSMVDYLEHDALRFGDSVLQHTVSSKNDFPEQAWADTLFMAAFFLVRVGIQFHREDCIQDALHQFYWHIKYLFDPDTGFCFHGYNHVQQNHMSGIYWGRANAWIAYTMSETLSTLPEWYLYPECMEMSGALGEMLSALKYVQTENGLWRTVLNDEASYEEVSASCGIAAAMVRAGNPLHRKYVKRALDGVLSNISEDGRVRNVSGGTAVMKNIDGYRRITKDWMQGWGQGLALVFLSDVIDSGKDSCPKQTKGDDKIVVNEGKKGDEE